MYVQDVHYGVCEDVIDIYNIKLLFHKYIYSDRKYVDILMNIISRYIDLLVIDYNESTKTVSIKIKKTSMKKLPSFRHCIDFYYNSFSHIFSSFFT